MEATDRENGRNVFDVLSRRKIVALVTLAIGIVLAIAAAVIIKPSYGATAHVLLVNDQAGRDPASEGVDLPTIATSTSVVEAMRAKLKLTTPVDKLQKAITVRVSPHSSILTIAAKDSDPSTAIAITNTLADEFSAFYANVSGGRYQNVVDKLSAELREHRAKMTSLEARLQQSASDSSYVGSQTSLDNAANNLNALVTQRTFAYAQLVSDQAELSSSSVQPGQFSKIVRHEMLANDQNYHQTEIEVSKNVANLSLHKADETDSFPGLAGEEASVRDQIHTLRDLALNATDGPAAYSPSLAGQIVAQQKASAAVQGDVAKVRALEAQIRATQQELSSIPSSGVSVGAIREMRDAEEGEYQAIALRLSTAEANRAEANSLGSIVLVDRAVVAEPGLLSRPALLALGFLVAIGLAIGAAYIAESIRPRFIGPGDVETLYGRPVIGSLNAV